MLAVPTTTPVIRPEPDTAVAIPVLALLQLPPVVASLKIVVEPVQTVGAPVAAGGNPLIVMVCVAAQPVPTVYEISTLPADIPVTFPLTASTVAVPVPSLLQEPPVVTSATMVVEPAQSTVDPLIAKGVGLTVRVVAVLQPASVYSMVEVPAPTPVIIPVADVEVAMLVVALLHVPPVIPSPNVIVEPAQTTAVPVIADGTVFTVTIAVLAQPVLSA